MAEKLTDHPLLLYLTFVLPMLLLALGIIFHASSFQIIVIMAWLGVTIIIFYLPIASDNGTSG
ncbi:MAG: hypothetical protein KJ672_00880 [Candidatus Thermoplasmatota archaeon]|nr:hypothetical protein [Candidatus Thermoplasmatota archaeon]